MLVEKRKKMSNFSENLQDLLIRKNINKNQFCKQLNISNSSFYKIFNHSRQPKIDTLLKIASYFNCSLDFLLGRTENETALAGGKRVPLKVPFNKQLKINNTNINRVANSIGTNTATIYRWLNNETYPTIEYLIKLADYFGCTVDYLVGLEKL